MDNTAIRIDSKIPLVFNQIRPGATFVAVNGYKNNNSEVSDFGIVFHFNYNNCVKKSLDVWKNISNNTLSSVYKQAKCDLIGSYSSTLSGFNPNYKNSNSYTPVKDADNNLISGVKLNIASNELHMFGLVFNKRIITPGNYKKVNSSELTLAKKKLLSLAPISKFRQFKLVSGSFKSITVQKTTLTEFDLL